MPLIPTDWLADHVELPADITPESLAADLVRVGLEEEEIHRSDVTGPLVVGKVLTLDAKKQKNGKVINYCRVDVGEHNDAPGEGKEPSDLPSRGIICGAHNFGVGDYVVVSLPGAVLPGGFEISARKTYGHISDGMICSFAELGLPGDASGIIVLAGADEDQGDLEPGQDAMGLLGLDAETLEINVTPDRGYCFSMRGVAREYSHSTGAAFTDRGVPAALDAPLPEPTADGAVISDDNPIHGNPGATRFVTRVVRGVDPTRPSPEWMQRRLTEAGMRPISLAVDATNYVMLDIGQPLHAYDLDKVRGLLHVRRATAGEKLTTLDDVERNLDPEDLLICDDEGKRVLALAGVMGGASTEIDENTTNVLVEAAHFDPVTVARTARRHRLPSESAKRFERWVDPELPPVAAQRVVDLLVAHGGGEAGEASDVYSGYTPATIAFDPAEVTRLTGLTLTDDRVRELLTLIGCTVDESFNVTAPTWRADITEPADLVEEVARLTGYDEIASELPAARAGRGLTLDQRRRRDMVRTLAEAGWREVLSYPFISQAAFDKQGIADDDERRTAIRLANPLQDDAPLLRTSLLDTLLATAALNVARGNPGVAVMEAGHVARPSGITPAPVPTGGSLPDEQTIAGLYGAIPSQPHHLAGVATPLVRAERAGLEAVTWDWRDAIEAVCSAARVIGARAQVAPAARAPFHPGRCAEISVAGEVIGYAGELAPKVCQKLDLPARSIAFELDTDALSAARGGEAITVDSISVYPAAKEDIALVVAEDVRAEDVAEAIREAGGDILEDVVLFDVYTGSQLAEGTKSLAYALRMRADHTLTAKETQAARERIVAEAGRRFGATLRA